MEIKVETFQAAAMEGNYVEQDHQVTAAALAKSGVAKAMAPVFADFDAAILAGKLVQSQLTVKQNPETIIRLESGIINLPFADAKKIPNFLALDSEVPLNVYLIVISPDVNVSGLRIDLMSSAADYLADQTAQQAAIISAIEVKLAEIAAHHEQADVVEGE